MQVDDIIADISMYYSQIIELADLMIETNNTSVTNIITIRELAQNGLDKTKMFDVL